MGIPSYFRRIIQKFPGIVSQKPTAAGSLCFDFNCLIYRCIRADSMASVPVPSASDPASVDVWEEALLKEVKKTVKEVWVVAGKPPVVFLAVDGVVPSAKIRQQRVRRFKSAWARGAGGPNGGTVSEGPKGYSGWDSNSITPGTEFMQKLTRMLEGLVKEKPGWILSSVDEAGEGEHKIMNWLKRQVPGAASVVYGLDADLILLSMLTSEITGIPIWLLREKQEFGSKMSLDAAGEQEYTYMNVGECKRRMSITNYQETINYIALMSLMGNDFLPHSVTHKLSDDGHECVVAEFSEMRRTGRWLVAEDKMQLDVLGELCKRWSADEDGRMVKMIRAKREQAGRGVGRGMDASEALPLEWDVEKAMVTRDGRLVENWRDVYWSWIHPAGCTKAAGKICSEYVFGCQWILDYYLGKEVNKFWMFPSWIPPLWSDLSGWLAEGKQAEGKQAEGQELEEVACPSRGEAVVNQIQPEEQLAMVLPLESWGLVRSPQLRRLPALAPQMWPKQFSFFSVGRKWLWECEARVPVLTAERLREILKGAE